MVLFVNVVVGQYVEVKHDGHIVCGTVRYKGHLNGVSGDWIGVELEYPLGNHNGCWRGRQYFKCKADCGIFTHASNIRFRRQNRRSRDNYRRVNHGSNVDQSLFWSSDEIDQCDCYSVSPKYARQAKSAFSHISSDEHLFERPQRYHLQHSVGKYLPAATMLKPRFSQTTYSTSPVYCKYDTGDNDFLTKPTIPQYMMPHEVLKRQLERGGWEEFGLTQPRFLSV